MAKANGSGHYRDMDGRSIFFFFFFFSRKLFMFSKSVTVFDLLKKNGVKCFCLFAVIFR